MTPPAATAAARTADPRALRRSPRPSGPRRVSGPARTRATPGSRQASARTRINAAPGLSRSSHARTHAGSLAVAGVGVLSLPGRGIRTAARTLHEPGTLTDRLLRSRAWIGVVAGLLIGLVFLQVSLLKVNAGIGQSVQSASAFESQNAVVRSQIAALAEDGRITMEAGKLGMQMPAADAVRYLKTGAAGGVGGAGGAVTAADDASATDVSGDQTSADTGAAAVSDDGSTDDAAAADDSSADASAGYATDDTTSSEGTDTGGAAATDTGETDTSTDTASAGDTGAADTSATDSGTASADSGGAVAPSAG